MTPLARDHDYSITTPINRGILAQKPIYTRVFVRGNGICQVRLYCGIGANGKRIVPFYTFGTFRFILRTCKYVAYYITVQMFAQFMSKLCLGTFCF